MCFLKSGLYLCWILIVFTDILCPLLRCSIRIRISCLASLFHIVPLLPVVCCCFLACLGILDKVLSVCDTYLRFNRNRNVILESTAYECLTKCKESKYFEKNTFIITLHTIFQNDSTISRKTSRKRLEFKLNGTLENLISVKPKFLSLEHWCYWCEVFACMLVWKC